MVSHATLLRVGLPYEGFQTGRIMALAVGDRVELLLKIRLCVGLAGGSVLGDPEQRRRAKCPDLGIDAGALPTACQEARNGVLSVRGFVRDDRCQRGRVAVGPAFVDLDDVPQYAVT